MAEKDGLTSDVSTTWSRGMLHEAWTVRLSQASGLNSIASGVSSN